MQTTITWNEEKYRKVSNIRRTKSQDLNVSHLGLQLSLCNILKPSVKWRMKIWSWQHQTKSNSGFPCISVLCDNDNRATITDIIFTHSYHIFLDVSLPLVPGIRRSVTGVIQDEANCTCPYHLSRRLQRTAVISAMPIYVVVKLWVLHTCTNDDWYKPASWEGIPNILLPVFVQTPVIRSWW